MKSIFKNTNAKGKRKGNKQRVKTKSRKTILQEMKGKKLIRNPKVQRNQEMEENHAKERIVIMLTLVHWTLKQQRVEKMEKGL